MTSERALDPAIETLLREIAADPASSLLRVPRANTSLLLAEPSPVIRASATWLSGAERELVRAHRSELVQLLRDAYVMGVYTGPASEVRNRIVRATTWTRSVHVRDEQEWLREAASVVSGVSRDSSLDAARELIGTCVAGGSARRIEVSVFAAAAQRLQPTDHARLYAGLSLIANGDEAAAKRVLESVLVGCPRRSDAAYAWLNLGLIASNQGRKDEALRSTERALRLMPELAPAQANQLLFALQVGDSRSIDQAAEILDSNGSPDHELIRVVRTTIERGWADGTIGLDQRERASVEQALPRLGAVSGSIAVALLSGAACVGSGPPAEKKPAA